MSDHVEPDEGLETTPIVLDSVDREWAEVVDAAPSVGRLPDEVASLCRGTGQPDESNLEEMQDVVRERVRGGVILAYRILQKDNMDRLYQAFNIHLGSAAGLMMDDLLESAANEEDSSVVENYSATELCGRFLAYVAMVAYCRQLEHEEEIHQSRVDPITGLLKDMDVMAVSIVLQTVFKYVILPEDMMTVVRDYAMEDVHANIYLLLEPNTQTTWH